MRALAWWQSVPAPPESEKTDPKKAPKPRKSRQQALGDDVQPDMPEIEPETRYLLDTFMEAGPVSVGASGPTTLTWADIAAWSSGTSIELEPWEARLVRRLSSEYLSEARRAEAHDALPPWVEAVLTPAAKTAVSLRDSIRGLKKLAD